MGKRLVDGFVDGKMLIAPKKCLVECLACLQMASDARI